MVYHEFNTMNYHGFCSFYVHMYILACLSMHIHGVIQQDVYVYYDN